MENNEIKIEEVSTKGQRGIKCWGCSKKNFDKAYMQIGVNGKMFHSIDCLKSYFGEK